MPAPRLVAADSLLVVVDVQDKLLAAVPGGQRLVREVGFLLDAASLLGVPAAATEQYPKGLGPTTTDLLRRLPAPPVAKTAFSCCGATGFLDDLRRRGRKSVLVCGMETHVCVLHTALDLLDAGFTVFVPADAVASRAERDAEVALRRLERAGAVLTTAETAVFEWVADANHPQFKAVSRLVVDRGRDR